MNPTILLVEDETDIRSVYAEVLRDAALTVVEASDGEEALKFAREGAWDLMLLDIMLPKIDGLEVLRKLHDEASLKDRPVVLLTNLGRESIIKEGFTIGASGYLIKSELTPDQVVAEVKGFLKKS